MKIGILTLELVSNYGGVLQAFALYHTLERMGHEPCLISTRKLKEPKLKKRIKWFVSRCIEWVFPLYITYQTSKDGSRKNFIRFINEKLPNKIYPTDLKQLNGEFDALVVGSDQVWRPVFSEDVRMFFLDFAMDFKHVKRIAYAASFGLPDLKDDEWRDGYIDECATMLKKFDAVSVRENDAVDICKNRFGFENAKWVLDPTMLLAPTDYLQEVPVATKGKFVNYILDMDSTKEAIISTIEKTMGTKTIYLKDEIEVSHQRPLKFKQHRSIESWLTEIASAEFVFTDSFHGCVFCIIFNKPFAVRLNAQRGNARFNSLMQLYGLQDRMVKNAEDVEKVMALPIDWETVNEKRHQMIEKSIGFLRNALWN